MGAQISSLDGQDAHAPGMAAGLLQSPEAEASRQRMASSKSRGFRSWLSTKGLRQTPGTPLTPTSAAAVEEDSSASMGENSIEDRLLWQHRELLQENIRLHRELLITTQQYMASLQELEELKKYMRGPRGSCSCCDGSCCSRLSLKKLRPRLSSPASFCSTNSAGLSRCSSATTEALSLQQPLGAGAPASAAAGATVTITTTGAAARSSSKWPPLGKAAKRLGSGKSLKDQAQKKKAAAGATAAAGAAAPPGADVLRSAGSGQFYPAASAGQMGSTAGRGFYQRPLVVDVARLVGMAPGAV